jgi:PPM family protein phosphatase
MSAANGSPIAALAYNFSLSAWGRMNVRPGLEAAGLTDIGCHRENNEDNYAYWESSDDAQFQRLGRLAIIADGMGGAEGGQYASRLAVDAVRDAYSASNEEGPQQSLLRALCAANARVQQEAQARPALRGMGTTLTACAIVGNNLYFAHLGDSRLLLIREGQARQLSRDHSLVARLVETGTIRAEDAEKHPQKHVLTAAIGVSEDIQPDFPPEPLALQPSDTILICTDGLWGQITPEEMASIASKTSPQDACKALVQLARDRGGPDNITLQILRVS